MAAYFRLYNKGMIGKEPPAIFQDVDDQMREAFDAEPDSVNWFKSWYDVIGLMMALGRDEDYIRTNLQDWDYVELLAPLEWLLDRFDVDSWFGR